MAEAWPGATFLPALRRGNVMGALDMGLAPGLLPGRVGLDEGRAWFEAAWGSVPAARGRDARAMLGALADGTMSAVVLVGSDPVGDFPDRALAQEALGSAGFVVAVDGFLSPSAALADVVLPVAITHERTGTTTNIEGRVMRLAQKLVAPGQCWPDWMVAAELADRLSGGLGVSSAAELWDEIERLAPSHAGITRAVLDNPSARDGIVAPLPASPVRITSRGGLAPFDPMATPGIDAVEAQGAPPRAGLAEPPGGDELPSLRNGASSGTGGASGRPRPLRWPVPVEVPHLPALDGYSLRLVASRRLYDHGVMVEACRSLAPLAAEATVRANPHDLGLLGVTTSQRVRVRSSRAALVFEAIADEAVPRGVLSIDFNLHGLGAGPGTDAGADDVGVDDAGAEDAGPDVPGGASALIDVRQPVVDVRLETL
jgi:predicted molibdopterin-dependent oxidoreductase YjgC